MVGGVVEAIAISHDQSRITVIGTGCEKKDICHVVVSHENGVEFIKPGDYLWWQSGKVYWTPLKSNDGGVQFLYSHWKHKMQDYPFQKLGYSF